LNAGFKTCGNDQRDKMAPLHIYDTFFSSIMDGSQAGLVPNSGISEYSSNTTTSNQNTELPGYAGLGSAKYNLEKSRNMPALPPREAREHKKNISPAANKRERISKQKYKKTKKTEKRGYSESTVVSTETNSTSPTFISNTSSGYTTSRSPVTTTRTTITPSTSDRSNSQDYEEVHYKTDENSKKRKRKTKKKKTESPRKKYEKAHF